VRTTVHRAGGGGGGRRASKLTRTIRSTPPQRTRWREPWYGLLPSSSVAPWYGLLPSSSVAPWYGLLPSSDFVRHFIMLLRRVLKAWDGARFVFKEPMKGPPGGRPAPLSRPSSPSAPPVQPQCAAGERRARPRPADTHGHRGPARAGARVGYVLGI
jgi:hypothetical protein